MCNILIWAHTQEGGRDGLVRFRLWKKVREGLHAWHGDIFTKSTLLLEEQTENIDYCFKEI